MKHLLEFYKYTLEKESIKNKHSERNTNNTNSGYGGD